MTSIENLIDDQRAALLELGFSQRHGFLYVISLGDRNVEFSIGSDGVWTATAAVRLAVVDEMRLSPGITLRTFTAVAASFI